MDATQKTDLARKIVTKADEYQEWKRPFAERCTDIYYDYIGRVRQGFDDIKSLDKNKKDWRTKIYPKFTKTKVLAAWSQMIQTVMSNKALIEVIPNDKSSEAPAKLMREEVLSQLEEADLTEKIKIGILENVLYGTMFMQGPVPISVKKKKWKVDMRGTLSNYVLGNFSSAYQMVISSETLPTIYSRNFFEVYPAPYATDLSSCEGIIHRPFISEYDLIELSNVPGFDVEAIRACLTDGPQEVSDIDYTETKSSVRFTGGKRKGFDLIYYAGKLKLSDLANPQDNSDTPKEPFGYAEVFCWVINGGKEPRIIKFEMNPDILGRRGFYSSVFERVPYESFGVGIGENIKDISELITGAVRLFIDAKKMALPQVAINTNKWDPGGSLSFAPFKIWRFNGDPREAISSMNFPDISVGLTALIELAERYADEFTGVPKWTTGTESRMLNKTATGISMLMNAQSQLMRGAVENLDDYVIEPIGEGFVDWNMEFSQRPDIKGDYYVAASGLSSLMQKETLNQQLLGLLSFIVNPMVLQNPIALKFLRIVGDNIGIKNVDSILPDPDKMETMAGVQPEAIVQELSDISSPSAMAGVMQ